MESFAVLISVNGLLSQTSVALLTASFPVCHRGLRSESTESLVSLTSVTSELIQNGQQLQSALNILRPDLEA
jgi:hypothetical protein